MSILLADAARSLLASESGTGETTSEDVAVRAADAFDQLVRHLSRVLGETGMRALLNRSVHLASMSFPWLASSTIKPGDARSTALRASMGKQSPEVATDAFVLVMSTLIGLLIKLVGQGLMTRVLHQVWPTLFPGGAKETP